MLFWVVWFLFLSLFLCGPIVCYEHRRRALYQQVRFWITGQRPDPPRERANGTHSGSGFRYVLSKQQEDEIRESFVQAKIKAYTMTLTPEMIVAPDQKKDNMETDDIMETKSGPTDIIRDIEAPTEASSSPDDVVDPPTHETRTELETTKKPPATSTAAPWLLAPQKVLAPQDEEDYDAMMQRAMQAMQEQVDEEPEGQLQGLPLAGQVRPSTQQQQQLEQQQQQHHDATTFSSQSSCRHVANGCAICLCAFDASEQVCWSSNPSCQHVFHPACMVDWLQASGRKYLRKMRRQQREREQNEDEALEPLDFPTDPLERITTFPMLCPCCRQAFVSPDAQEDDEEADDADDASESTVDPKKEDPDGVVDLEKGNSPMNIMGS